MEKGRNAGDVFDGSLFPPAAQFAHARPFHDIEVPVCCNWCSIEKIF